MPSSSAFPSAVTALLQSLSRLPYENLSKIVARHQGHASGKTPEGVLSFSASWLEDHARTGLGGTCFALTHWLKLRLDALGFSSAYLMADKRIEPNIHCGLVLWHDEREWLLDPGYLIFDTIPLPCGGLSVELFLSPNAVSVEGVTGGGRAGGDVWRLWTGPRGALKHRFDFRREPVDAGEFQRHWEASYAWPMMNHPVLNRVVDGTQYYLQKNNLLVRTAEGGTMTTLTPSGVRAAATDLFGLPRGLVDEALRLTGYVGEGQG
jgi:arylamine N-acetyltransferase